MANKNEEMMKRAVISGASHALRYKEEHPRDRDDIILKRIVRELREIIGKIDGE